MKATKEKIESELETCVAHISRQCGNFQDEIWKTMYELSKEKINGNKDIL